MTKSPRRLKQQVRDTVGEQVRDLPLHAVRLAMFGVGRALLLGDRVSRDYKEITQGGGVKPVLERLRNDVQSTAEKVVERVVERVRGEETRPESDRRDGAGSTGAGRAAGEEIAVGKPGGPARPAPRYTRPGPPPKPPKRSPAPGGPGAETAGPSAEPKPKPEPESEDEAAKDEVKAADEAPAAKDTSADEARYEPKPESKPAAQAEAEQIAEELPVPNYDSATLPQLRARLRGLTVEQVKLLREYERKHAAREDVIRMYERRIAKLNGLN
ncbi:MAG TPA: hypothetical protein VIL71_15565 [Spirillospora sp.]